LPVAVNTATGYLSGIHNYKTQHQAAKKLPALPEQLPEYEIYPTP